MDFRLLPGVGFEESTERRGWRQDAEIPSSLVEGSLPCLCLQPRLCLLEFIVGLSLVEFGATRHDWYCCIPESSCDHNDAPRLQFTCLVGWLWIDCQPHGRGPRFACITGKCLSSQFGVTTLVGRGIVVKKKNSAHPFTPFVVSTTGPNCYGDYVSNGLAVHTTGRSAWDIFRQTLHP